MSSHLVPVSQESRTLFGPEKPFMQLRPAYSENLVFSGVAKGIKSKVMAKLCALRSLHFQDIGILAP